MRSRTVIDTTLNNDIAEEYAAVRFCSLFSMMRTLCVKSDMSTVYTWIALLYRRAYLNLLMPNTQNSYFQCKFLYEKKIYLQDKRNKILFSVFDFFLCDVKSSFYNFADKINIIYFLLYILVFFSLRADLQVCSKLSLVLSIMLIVRGAPLTFA